MYNDTLDSISKEIRKIESLCQHLPSTEIMGIKGLSTYIKNCGRSGSTTRTLASLQGTRVVVDASIYMYRYQAQNDLVGGMYAMVSLLEHHGIQLHFVFDGTPPTYKFMALEERKMLRQEAQNELARLEKIVVGVPPADARELNTRIQRLRRQCTRLTNEDIVSVKTLLTLMGVGYTVADGEADRLCAKLVLCRVMDACLSDDTDMFAYGCPRVLRYLSVLGETVVYYDYSAILHDLGMTPEEFRSVCVASGTDYNSATQGFGRAYSVFARFKSSVVTESFTNWLIGSDSGGDTIDECEFWSAYLMYNLNDVEVPKVLRHRRSDGWCHAPPKNHDGLRSFLGQYDFLFT